jgi:hypothetical protein
MRARAGLSVLDRVADDLLGDGVPRVPRLWGEHGPLGGGPARLPQARRDPGQAFPQGRDVAAERDLIRSALHVAHQRRARRRRLLTRLV